MDFRNTIIVLTSNLGSEILAATAREKEKASTREAVMDVVRKHFRPEFLNRLDEMLIFHRLSRADMSEIVAVQLTRLSKLLSERKITLEFTKEATEWLADAGFDPVYGARPLKRVIQRTLQNALAQKILEGAINDGDHVRVGVEKGELAIVPAR